METEIASYILCECVASAELRFLRLGKHFTEPSNYDKIPLCKILYFVRGMGLMGMHNKSENGHSARVALWMHPTYTPYLTSKSNCPNPEAYC
jgi:hypothetical protein